MNMDPTELAAAVQAGISAAFGDAAELATLGLKEILTPKEVEQLFGYPVSTQEKDRRNSVGPAYIKRFKDPAKGEVAKNPRPMIRYRRRDVEAYFGSLRVKTRDQG